MPIWNPWHGCHKISPGCYNCYVYRRDAEFGKDSSIVTKTANFDMPIKRNRQKQYKLQPSEEPVRTRKKRDDRRSKTVVSSRRECIKGTKGIC